MNEFLGWIREAGVLGWVMIVAGCAAAGAVVAAKGRFLEHARHLAMWRRVARLAGLAARERALMVDMAKCTGVRNPASLALGKGCFNAARAEYVKGKGAARAVELKLMEEKLFLKDGSALVTVGGEELVTEGSENVHKLSRS